MLSDINASPAPAGEALVFYWLARLPKRTKSDVIMIPQHTVECVTEITVKIDTNAGHGTGFVYRVDDHAALIVTAAHVLADVKSGESSITLSNGRWLPSITLEKSEWKIIKDTTLERGDTIILSVKPGIFAKLRKIGVEIGPSANIFEIGEEVGWAGFPTTHPDTLCFFSGHISACTGDPHSRYLVDGVAVPGVSGGPLFPLRFSGGNTWIILIGAVSCFHRFYLPRYSNNKGEDAFPALMQAERLDQMGDFIAEFDRLNKGVV